MADNQHDGTAEALPLRFGILAPQIVPYTVQVERWRELDDYGFDSLWFADHFVNPAMPAGRWFEAYTLMAAAATQTERIRVGALVTSITFRHPALLAKEALTIDHISDGRFELGIGAAGARNDFEMTGLPAWEPRERARRFREFVLAVVARNGNFLMSWQLPPRWGRCGGGGPGWLLQPPPLGCCQHLVE